MSDVTIAPPSAAPSTSPPTNSPTPSSAPTHEVPINEPVSRPNPIGSQLPPVDKSQAKHDRDPKASIKAAFDRANNPQVKVHREPASAPKAAEAKAGHNQPPEETEKFDLKKRPGDVPRGERGQFAPRARDNGDTDAKGMIGTQTASSDPTLPGQTEYKRLPPHAPFAEPPQRISERARRDWADTPETVRGDMHRMHHEFGQAYQQYRGAAEAFQPVARFHQMALAHNTTLEKALENYTSIEDLLRRNVVAGLDQIINNLGLTDPQTNQRIGFRDVAYHVLSQSPEQLQQVQMGNQQMAASHQLAAANQRIERLENEHRQMQYAQHFHYTRSAVDQFAEQHPRIDEKDFGEVVKREIELGFPLDVAYQRAERLHPATHAEQIRTTPAQTRPPDRSIHGSPDVAPSNGASRRPKEPSKTPELAVQNAIRRMNGHA